jgi:tetratricopeptide (TPR) repeat protein
MTNNRIKSQRPTFEELEKSLNLFNAGEFNLAEKAARNLIRKYPNHPFGWKLLGVSLKQSGRVEESLLPFKNCLLLDPKDAEGHNNLGVTLSSLDQLTEAASCFDRAITINPKFAEAYNNLANTQQKLGELNKAELNCLKAIKLKTDYAEAYCNLSSILQSLKKHEEAKTYCMIAIELNQLYPEAYNNLGNIYNSLGLISESEDSYKKALGLNQNFFQAYNNLGAILQNQGKLLDAHDALIKAIELCPNYSDAILNLALNYFFLDECVLAAKEYRKLIDIDPSRNGIKAAIDLAVMNFLAGNYVESAVLLNKSRIVLSKTDFEFKYYLIYWNYLNNLLGERRLNIIQLNKVDSKIIHVVGESHALASHDLRLNFDENEYICKSYWIPGCKQ